MTKLLKKALERVSVLPENEQDAIASIILEELEDVRLLVRAAALYLEGGEKWKGVERLERALALKPDDEAIAARLREAGGSE